MYTPLKQIILLFICITTSFYPATPAGTPGPLKIREQEKEKKKIVFIAGPPSHGKGEHEFKAGCTLLAKLLNESTKNINAVVYHTDWPTDPSVLADADAVVIYCDGGGGHMVIPHLEEMDKLMKKGVGLVLLHYAVELPKGPKGNYFLSWVGGYFETYWSVNPFWNATFKNMPPHAITRGVAPFEAKDEWYYHIRFADDMKNVTPLLVTLPPKSTLNRPDGSHDNNAFARADIEKGIPQTMAWAFERAKGGRGFGFTGGHMHNNWMNDNFRKFVLNAIVWSAKLEVPKKGVHSIAPSQSEMDSLMATKK